MAKKSNKLRLRREQALNRLASVITELYGDRCDRHEGACIGCVVWSQFDMMERLTDTSFLDDK